MQTENKVTPTQGAPSFWDIQAAKLPWFKHWDTTLDWKMPHARWFVGGQINASYACLDVHLHSDRRDHVALRWESETGDALTLTYAQLHDLVNRWAALLQAHGVRCGDMVVVYMPMIPEAVCAMLACARLGATHCVVFSGFSAQALAQRIADTNARFVVTADATVRRGKQIALKAVVDQALEDGSSVQTVLVVNRFNCQLGLVADRDVVVDLAHWPAQTVVAPQSVESTHPLFVLYTSGTTGKPKGIVHGTGGYLTYAYASFGFAFGQTHQPETVYWCTADIGWIMGHTYVVYAPLMHGLSVLIYEDAPDYPDAGNWWHVIQRHGVSILYTSPTALRLCKRYGDEWVHKYDLSSLRLLGSVGEPINPEVWQWYHDVVGQRRCPVIDTWWQTETGGFMISPMAGQEEVVQKPGSAGKPLPGVQALVVDQSGNVVPDGTKGYLVITQPWPGMMQGVYNDDQRYQETYWSKFPGMYYAGDYAIKDEQGNFWLLGRADEVLNIAGHRIGTAEIESALVKHPLVAEAAVVGLQDQVRGEIAVAFVMLRHGATQPSDLCATLTALVRGDIGPFVILAGVYVVQALPKTRSGKIMRRLLKAVVQQKAIGDVTTLEDGASIEQIQEAYQELQRQMHSKKT